MKNILILTYGSKNHASSRLRALNHIDYIKNELGYKVVCVPRTLDKKKSALNRFIIFPITKRINLLKRIFLVALFKWDFIYAQRIFLTKFELFFLRGKLIFDFDDAIFFDRKDSNAKMKTDRMILKSSHTIVSTPALTQYCAQLGVSAIENYTPVEPLIYTENANLETETLKIGWIGSPSTTQYLNIIANALVNISKTHDIELILMGADKKFNIEGISVRHYDWSIEEEANFLKSIDIGIMPLDDTDWAAYKGGFKLLQYMSASKPIVCSPIGINKLICEDNINGFWASTENEWEEKLLILLNNKTRAIEMGKNGYDKVIKNYSVDIFREKLAEILSESKCSLK